MSTHDDSEKKTMLKMIIETKTCLLQSIYENNEGMKGVDFSTVLGSDAGAYRNFDPMNIKVSYIETKDGKKLGCEIQENGARILRVF